MRGDGWRLREPRGRQRGDTKGLMPEKFRDTVPLKVLEY